ncbi:MAG: zf-HC2 domain-containing protein [Clostridiaceae bacterium]|nr:zf-HC2 domain-containing protein [Clostridiaceae bacterium]
MSNQCAVIRDLMPLYAESMASKASAEIIEEHLAGCQSCRDYLNEIRQSVSNLKDTDTSALRQMKKRLQRRKMLVIIVTLMLTMVVITTVIAYLTAPDYLPYSSEVVAVSELDDGTVQLIFDESIAGYDLSYITNKNGVGREYSLTAWNTTWNKWFQRHRSNQITILNPNGEKVEAVFYYQTNDQPDLLIYSKGTESSGGQMTLPRLVLNLYFMLAIGFLIISGIAWLVFRRNRMIENILSKITFLPAAYIAGHLVITGFNATTYHSFRDFIAILLVMFLFYVALISAQAFVRSNRRIKQ